MTLGNEAAGGAEAGAGAAVTTRRRLLWAALWGSLGAAAAGGVLAGIRYLWPGEPGGIGPRVRVPAGEVPQPGEDPKHFPQGRFHLMNLRPGDHQTVPARASTAANKYRHS